MKRIRRGDRVIITTGRSKGQVGTVLRVSGDSVFVEGANLVKKTYKPNPQTNDKGGIRSIEAPLHISNVAMYNPISKKADKVGFKFIEENNKKRKVRYFKSNNEIIDVA